MRYVQLRAFHNVAIHGGFSKAAEALFLTQPAISDQVRKLEEEYDILLFDRHKRQVRLTDKGEQLLEITNRLFDNEQQALDYLTESRALAVGTLRLIVDSAYHITDLLREFQTLYPKIRIKIRVGNSQAVTDALYSYQADIGVLGELVKNHDLEVMRLGASPLVAFAAKAGVHAAKRHISYQDLADCVLVLREDGSKTRQRLQQAANEAGVTLGPTIEAQGREAVREIVAAGNGIGFVSTAEFGQDERLFSIDLPKPSPVMQEVLICMKERKDRKLIKAFMAVARANRVAEN
jgi:aminoethylphosphonate catabolism LysR family transcriptional regulator